VDTLPPSSRRLAPQVGTAYEQFKHALQVGAVTAVEGKSGALDHFLILRNIASQNANARRHRIEQGERHSFNRGWKHE